MSGSMSRVLLVAGVLLFLVSALADSLGLGKSPGLGIYQIVGIVVGVVLAAFGMIRGRKASKT